MKEVIKLVKVCQQVNVNEIILNKVTIAAIISWFKDQWTEILNLI